MDAIAELFSTRGRVNRGWYAAHVLLDDLLLLGLMFSMIFVGEIVGSGWMVLPLAGATAAVAWAAMAVTIKRFHDLGKSGWTMLWLAVPLVNIYFGFKLLFGKGVRGANAWGADPLTVADVSGYAA